MFLGCQCELLKGLLLQVVGHWTLKYRFAVLVDCHFRFICSGATWWLKGDGVDIVSGIQESVRQQWFGDVDLDDGKLQEMYQEYMNLVMLVDNIGLGPSRDSSVVISQLSKCLKFLREDKEYLVQGINKLKNYIINYCSLCTHRFVIC